MAAFRPNYENFINGKRPESIVQKEIQEEEDNDMDGGKKKKKDIMLWFFFFFFSLIRRVNV